MDPCTGAADSISDSEEGTDESEAESGQEPEPDPDADAPTQPAPANGASATPAPAASPAPAIAAAVPAPISAPAPAQRITADTLRALFAQQAWPITRAEAVSKLKAQGYGKTAAYTALLRFAHCLEAQPGGRLAWRGAQAAFDASGAV